MQAYTVQNTFLNQDSLLSGRNQFDSLLFYYFYYYYSERQMLYVTPYIIAPFFS